MKQLFTLAAAPAAAFLALALASISTPAAAAKYEYCRTDVSSAMRSCGFTSLEQCQTMSAGRGGTWARGPFLPEGNSGHNHFASPPPPTAALTAADCFASSLRRYSRKPASRIA